MGYHFKRVILPPGDNKNKVIELAHELRANTNRNCVLEYSYFSNKKYRKEHLKTSRELGLNYIELDTPLYSKDIIEVCKKVFGENGFLYREQDDDEIDVIYPDNHWLSKTYGSNQLDWILNVIEDKISLNIHTFYSIPSNPEPIGVEIPIFAALLKQVRPGEKHPCPMCGSEYISKFPRRQCKNPECAFGYIPFESRDEALTIKEIQLDAFAWGKCPRGCGKSIHFNNRIEQCYKCGQLIKAVNGKFSHELNNNENEVSEILSKLKKSDRKIWQFWK